MNQIAGANGHSANVDRRSEIDQMHAGVGDTNAPGKVLEAQRMNFVEIAHMAVGDDANTAQAPVYVGLNLSKIGADTRRIIEVLHHDDARFGEFQDALPEIVA